MWRRYKKPYRRFHRIIQPSCLRNKLIIQILFSGGLRVAELVNLKMGDIAIEESEVRIIGKGRKERITFISETTLATLANYLERAYPELASYPARPGDFLLVNYRGEKITDRSVHRMLSQLTEVAGIEKTISPHTSATALRRIC